MTMFNVAAYTLKDAESIKALPGDVVNALGGAKLDLLKDGGKLIAITRNGIITAYASDKFEPEDYKNSKASETAPNLFVWMANEMRIAYAQGRGEQASELQYG